MRQTIETATRAAVKTAVTDVMAGAVIKGTVRAAAGTALVTIGVIHGLWARGSSWPASSRRRLAKAVAGTRSMPPAESTAVMAVGTTAVGALVLGVLGNGTAVRWARRGVGAALLGRALTGGGITTGELGMRSPGRTFRRLDAAVYRPLCAVLGIAVLLTA